VKVYLKVAAPHHGARPEKQLFFGPLGLTPLELRILCLLMISLGSD
jgi:hypothetical protein